MIEAYGDGFKAYHAILYHAAYDSTWSHYEGMNYPYGEHVVPGASQPLLSNSLRLVSGGPEVATDFWIVHYSMLFGIWLGIIFLFLLLCRLDVNVWYAAAVSLILGFFTPQLDRVIAHYGLSHPEVLPAVLYFLRRWDERPHWAWSLAVALCVFLFSQIHFYYFAILAFTIGSFLAARYLLSGQWKHWWRYGWHLFLMFGLPAIYFLSWFALTDPVTDRNDAPWGFFAYRAYPQGVFASLVEPHWAWFSEHVVNIRSGDFESHAYVGLVAIGYLVYLTVRWARRRFGTWAVEAAPDERLYLNSLLLASFGVLLFAFGLPFVVVGKEALLEYTGPLRQFRSVGRFAWLFFYAVNICVFYELGRRAWDRSVSGSGRAKLFALAALLLLGGEAWFFCTSVNSRLDPIAELAQGNRFTDLPEIDYSRYQAIVPVPYFSIGSDNFWWDQSGLVAQKTFTISLQTGLPVTGAMLTRTSLRQTLKQLQAATEPYAPVAWLDDLPNDKPLLVVYDPVRWNQFGGHTNAFIEGSTLIYRADEYELYEMPLASFSERIAARGSRLAGQLDSLTVFRTDLPSPAAAGPAADRGRTYLAGVDSSGRLPADLIFENFADRPAGSAGLYTSTYFEGRMDGVNQLLDTTYTVYDSTALELSCWFFIGRDRFARTEFSWSIERDGQVIHYQQPSAGSVTRVFDPRDWILFQLESPVLPPGNYRITFRGAFPLLGGQPFRVDDVLLRPVGVDLYRDLGRVGNSRSVWSNNRTFSRVKTN